MKNILIVILTIFALGACGKEKKENVKIEKKPRPVRYMIAADKGVKYSRTFSGNITSEIESKLSFRVNGTIVNKYVKLGDYIKKGQVLAELDNNDYKLSMENSLAQYENSLAGIAEAEAGLKSAEASFENSKNEFSRMEKLYYDDNVSKSDYDIAKANNGVTEAQLAQAEASKKSAQASLRASNMALAQNKLNLGYTKLIAPQDGFIVAEEKEENETVASGTPIYIVSLGDTLETQTFIPENLIGNLNRGQEVIVEISALDEKVYRGKIKEIGVSSSGYGNSFPLKITLLEKNSLIKPGMSTKITFDLAQKEESQIVVPLSAVEQDASGNRFVYILTNIEGGVATVKKTIITLGKTYSEGIAIIEGIKTGDYIVSSGVSQITEGQIVAVSPREED
jgi:multidrug efflux system membrane fusion protein